MMQFALAPRRLFPLCRAWAAIACLASPLAAQSGRRSGDVTNDGAVTAADAQAVLKSVVGLALPASQDIAFGDANCDGKVGALDAQIILMAVVLMPVSQFCVGTIPGAAVATVSITGASTVAIAQVTTLTATLKDAAGLVVTGRPIVWESSAPAIAVVSASDGIVTGVAVGSATIKATSEGKNASVLITVTAPIAISSISVRGAKALMIGAGAQFVAVPFALVAGSPVELVDRVMEWSSRTPAIATVSSDGTVTALAAGTAIIDVKAEGKIGSASVTVLDGGPAPTIRWIGGDGTSWANLKNWDKNRVPTSSDVVLIPVGAATQPTLTAAASIASIIVEASAVLDVGVFKLSVNSRADVQGVITGNGAGIVAFGIGPSYMRGRFPSVSGSVDVIGPTVIAGDHTSGGLSINGQPVEIAGDASGGYTNESPSGDLLVGKSLLSAVPPGLTPINAQGFPILGAFQSGSIRVRGPITTFGSMSGTARLVLEGSGAKTLGTTNQMVLQHIEFNGTGDVSIIGSVIAQGNVSVGSPIVVGGAGPIRVFGNFTAPTGSTIQTSTIGVGRTLAVSGRFSPDRALFLGAQGTIQSVPSGANYLYKDVIIEWDAKLTAGTTVGGSLMTSVTKNTFDQVIYTGKLDINGQSISVVKDASAVLIMKSPTAVMNVLGNAAIDGELTAGVVRIGGNVTTYLGSSGTHKTVLNGGALQALSATVPANELRLKGLVFQDLEISNTVGVANQLSKTNVPKEVILVGGQFTVTSAIGITGTGALKVVGDFSMPVGSTIDLPRISLGGSLSALGSFTADETFFFGGSATAKQLIPGGPAYKYKVVESSGTWVGFGTGGVTVSGVFALTAGILDLNGQAATVAGNFNALAGLVRTRSASADLTVKGSVDIRGGGLIGALPVGEQTAGTIRAEARFVTLAAGWNPTEAQTVILTGTQGQYVKGDFQHLTIRNPAGIVIPNDAAVPALHQINVKGNMISEVAASFLQPATTPRVRLVVGGDLIAPVLSAYSAQAISIGGVLDVKGTFTADTTTFTGATQNVPGGAPYTYKAVNLAGGVAKFTGNTTMNGGLQILANAVGDLNGQTVTVTEDIRVTGTLRMTQAAGVLVAKKNARFTGLAAASGEQSAGRLEVGLNITGGPGWSPTGSHKVVMNGVAGSITATRFNDLDLEPTTSTGAVAVTEVLIAGNLNIKIGRLTGASNIGRVVVDGSLTTGPQSFVDPSVVMLSLGGVATVNGAFSPDTAEFVGALQAIPGGLAYRNITVRGPSVSMAGAATLTGQLAIKAGAVFDLNGKVVSTLKLVNQGTLKMMSATGVLTVSKDADFSGTVTAAGLQTAGELHVKGDFTITGSPSFFSYDPTLTHKTFFDGAILQAVRTNGATLNDVTTNNGDGVILNSSTLKGSLTVAKKLIVPFGSVVDVQRDLTIPAGASAVIDGIINYFGTYVPGGTIIGNQPIKK